MNHEGFSGTLYVSDYYRNYIDGLVQDCINSIANALELLQSCTKPTIWELPSSL